MIWRLAVFATAAAAAQAPKPVAQLPAELEPIFGIAMAAPPEFAARALLRIAPRIPDRTLRGDTIDMAFRLASRAVNPMPVAAIRGFEADSSAAIRAQAARLGLDMLSLQSEAVRLMAPVNARRARDLFGEINPPRIARATCEDAVVADPSPYYSALATVLQLGFSAKERADGAHIGLLRTAISRVDSAAELTPLLQIVPGLGWPAEEMNLVTGSLAAKLESIPADARTFGHYTSRLEPLTSAFEPAYRKFAARHDGEQSCEGHDAVNYERYWQSDVARQVYQQGIALRQAPNGLNLDVAARQTPEWKQQLGDLLRTLDGWSPANEPSETAWFHEKATVFEALADLAPAGEGSGRVIGAYVSFLQSAAIAQSNPAEWFVHSSAMLERLRGNPPQRERLLAAFRASGNLALVLEAMLEGLR